MDMDMDIGINGPLFALSSATLSAHPSSRPAFGAAHLQARIMKTTKTSLFNLKILPHHAIALRYLYI